MRKEAKRVSEIVARIKEMHSTIEKEQRALNDDEKRELKALEREQDMILLQSRAFSLPGELEKKVTIKSYLRDQLNAGKKTMTIHFRAEGAGEMSPTMMRQDVAEGALMPVTIGDVVKPLRENLIYNKIGIQVPTGCRGVYEWPVVEAVKATIAGEAVKVAAKKIDLSKVPVVKQRIAVVVEASRESLFESDGKLESIINEQLPLAVAETVNQIMTGTEKVTDDCVITGPFVGLTPTAVEYSFKGLNAAKAQLLKKGVRSDRMVFVMTEATKAELEATPKDAGSGIMVIENDRLCGLPVFCSEAIGDGIIGLGDFTYQVCAQFGDVYMIVDPYTGADANTVRFALNVDFGTATLRPEVFALYKQKA